MITADEQDEDPPVSSSAINPAERDILIGHREAELQEMREIKSTLRRMSASIKFDEEKVVSTSTSTRSPN